MKTLRILLSFLCVFLIICGCFGACVWLTQRAELEPLLQWEYRGDVLVVTAAQEQYLLPLTEAERAAEQLQKYWILLPPGFRLGLQGVAWLSQNVSL
ncbi:MAG: hypothetical protein IJ411_02295 [Oscillospiraceae bacterium]|nr:hypothetical protein [Oscillospiraceae bacterium]